MAAPESYITETDLLDFMRLDTAPEGSSFAIDAACASVRSFLDQEITFHADDVWLKDGHGTTRIRLPQRPVRGVSSLKVFDSEVDPADYRVHGDTGIVKLVHGYFPMGVDNIQVTYDHGWDIFDLNDSGGEPDMLPLPADLKYWTLVVARRRTLSQGDQDSGAKVSETIGIYSYSNDSALLAARLDLMPAEGAGLEHFAIRLKV